MASTDPIRGVSFELYAEIVANTLGSTDPNAMVDAADSRGIGRADWEAAMQGWGQRASSPQLAVRFKTLLTEALKKACGDDFEQISFEDYVNSAVAAYTGTPYEEVVASVGCDMRQYTLAGYLWTDALEGDPWQKARFDLLFRRGIAQKTGAGGREVHRYIPGTMIRGRKCPNCGSVKINPPETAYIYCDFCSTLFDYDSMVSAGDAGTLDNEEIDAILAEASGRMLRDAFEAGDKEEYARILRWRNEAATEVAPEGYSPRIKNAEYRRALIDGVLVPWQVATRFNTDYRALVKKVDAAHDSAMDAVTEFIGNLNVGKNAESDEMQGLKKRARAKILALLEISREAWDAEGEILEREGIFANHPDAFTRELFIRVNASNFVRPWLGLMPGDDGEAILQAAGVRHEYIEGPKVEMSTRGCGQCGRKLEIPEGAKKMLCEGCGQVLDLEHKTMPCPQCGAALAIAAGETTILQYHCGFCDAHFSL